MTKRMFANRENLRGLITHIWNLPASRSSTRLFAHSPVKRAKYRGWLRNLCVVMGNSGDRRFMPWLERMAHHPEAVVREHAQWALERLAKQKIARSAASGNRMVGNLNVREDGS